MAIELLSKLQLDYMDVFTKHSKIVIIFSMSTPTYFSAEKDVFKIM